MKGNLVRNSAVLFGFVVLLGIAALSSEAMPGGVPAHAAVASTAGPAAPGESQQGLAPTRTVTPSPALVQTNAGALSGLWVGEVYVNNVSEGRLGSTDVEAGVLTVPLRPASGSNVLGSALLREISGNPPSVNFSITLALPAPAIATPTPAAIATAKPGQLPELRGYVFVDANQNGERDADEAGLAGQEVALRQAGAVVKEATTGTDGGYLFESLPSGEYDLDLAEPAGYTRHFLVSVPIAATAAAPATASTAMVPSPVAALATPTPPPLQPRPNIWPVKVQIGATRMTNLTYNGQPPGRPTVDVENRPVQAYANFGLVSAYRASLWEGACSDRGSTSGGPVERENLGVVKNGVLEESLASAVLIQPSATSKPGSAAKYQLLGKPSYFVLVQGPDGVACADIVAGAPTRFDDGTGSEFVFRLILRVNEAGQTELLPTYTYQSASGLRRISSANFSLTRPVVAAGGSFGQGSAPLEFAITIGPDDPLNPYKHKYNPDHDNLDARFNKMDVEAPTPTPGAPQAARATTLPSPSPGQSPNTPVPTAQPSPPGLWEMPWLWESYEVRRLISLRLTEMPLLPGATQADATSLGWGSEVYGGEYAEVISGIHKNDITVRGYFVVRHAVDVKNLVPQEYDQTGGGR